MHFGIVPLLFKFRVFFKAHIARMFYNEYAFICQDTIGKDLAGKICNSFHLVWRISKNQVEEPR